MVRFFGCGLHILEVIERERSGKIRGGWDRLGISGVVVPVGGRHARRLDPAVRVSFVYRTQGLGLPLPISGAAFTAAARSRPSATRLNSPLTLGNHRGPRCLPAKIDSYKHVARDSPTLSN